MSQNNNTHQIPRQVFLLIMLGVCQTSFASKAITTETVLVNLKLEGKTVPGQPVIALKDERSRVMGFGNMNDCQNATAKTDNQTWSFKLAKGQTYVIGWKNKKGWFNQKLKAYYSGPFTANHNGQIVIFNPTLGGTLEYDLTKIPSYVKIFPINVSLFRHGPLGEKDQSQVASATVRTLKKIRFKNMAPGNYSFEAMNSPKSHGHEPYLYDQRPIRLDANKTLKLDPVVPILDTTVEPGDITITGKVVDAKGNPLPNKEVTLMVAGPLDEWQKLLFYKKPKTNKHGDFAFEGVIPGRTVSVWCEDTSARFPNLNKDISTTIVIGSTYAPIVTGNIFTPLPLINQQNKAINPEMYAGKIVVYDFWATWCSPCIHSLPKFNAMAGEMQSDELCFISVNVNKDVMKWQQKLSTQSWNKITHGWLDRTKTDILSRSFSIPLYVIVDQGGVVQHTTNHWDVKDKLNTLLATKH